MEGKAVSLLARTRDGQRVGLAEVAIFGRSADAGDRSTLVYSRQAVTDAGGRLEVSLPIGAYDILVLNPREGQWARLEGLAVGLDGPAPSRELTLEGSSAPGERAGWKAELLDRAELALYLWAK
jgi:hypothetical protein